MRRRLLIVLAILASAHVYIWWRLIAPLPSPWRLPATLAIALLTPSLPAVSILARSMPRRRARPYLLVGYLWFALATYLLLGAAASHLAVAAGVGRRTAALAGIAAAAA
ncbi:MAG TPA: hypothetical protein VHE35_36270, partial [Kofleriaceae bacterium]|nr:hypothetical protein [Kofleriaceae bacterium]